MSTARARILVLIYTPFASAPRALKQVQYLREAHDVTTAGFGSQGVDGIPHVEIPNGAAQRWGVLGRLLYLALLVLRIHRPIPALSARDRDTERLLGDGSWDVVIAHDLWALNGGLRLAPRRGVVLDLHEYAPREGEHSRVWRMVMAPYVRWMLRTMVPRVAAVVTVGQGIADEYRRLFGFDSTVVVNATPFHALEPQPVGAPIRLVHSGLAAPDRRLDLMIDAVRATTAPVTLDLYLVDGGVGELDRLRGLAEGEPRVRFPDAVPYRELVRTLNGYDVGLSVFPPTNFNLAWCLPNKFFDFIQGRLGVIVGPSPEMARFVDEYAIGEVLPDFDAASLAQALDALTPERVAAWKAASDAHAVELSSERQSGIWERLVDGLLVADPEPRPGETA
jgi:glycosyltransferase involved in cell wall biosynthesis